MAGCADESLSSYIDSVPELNILVNQPEINEIPLPIVDKKITLKCWYLLDSNLDSIKDYNDSEAYKKLEELTNIHIDFIHPSFGTEKDSFNLMFKSGDMPDIIYTDSSYQYAAGPEKAVIDKYYLDITDLVNKYAPNYKKIINSNESLTKDSVLNNGIRWGFNMIFDQEREAYSGIGIRQDFLEKVNKPIPITYDDWYDVLKAFKNQLNIESPLSIYKTGLPEYNEFLAGYGVGNSFYQIQGVIKYGPIEKGYGEYLEMMGKWYEEGLIDKNYLLRQGTFATPVDDLILGDKIGAWVTYATYCDKYYLSRGANNKDFQLVGAPNPIKKIGDKTHLRFPDRQNTGRIFAISASSKYPKECVMWLDFQYSHQGWMITNYGTREGETYVKVDNHYEWGPDIRENKNGLTLSQARIRFTTNNAMYESYRRASDTWSQVQKTSQKAWLTSDDDWALVDSINFTPNENKKFSSIMNDIDNYVIEYTTKSIMGISNVSFQDFVKQIKNMGIDQAIAIKQAALNRYIKK